MNTPSIAPLATGAIALVGLAIGIGQYERLESWARQQAIEAIAWKEPLPYFFAAPHGTSHKARSHAHRESRPGHLTTRQ